MQKKPPPPPQHKHSKASWVPTKPTHLVMMMRWIFRDVSRIPDRWMRRSMYTSDNRKHSELQPEYFSTLPGGATNAHKIAQVIEGSV